MGIWNSTCGLILRLTGWKVIGTMPPEKKCILLGVPHTSFLDFVVSYLYYKSIGGNALCMVKKELFFPPLGWLIRAMGGIPVDRKSPSSIVRSVLHSMQTMETFHLAIAPEGTRKPVRKWKTGYHLIAREAGIPVYLACFDWKRKQVGVVTRFELTDDAKADTARMQQTYKEMDLGARHPGNYLTE